jgi:hypothetical protein
LSTVIDLIRRILPLGSRPAEKDAEPSWDEVPKWPADVFAVVATLIERSSAYRQIIEPPETPGPPVDKIGILTPGDRIQLKNAGDCWAWTLLDVPEEETLQMLNEIDPALSAIVREMKIDLITESWKQLVTNYADDLIILSDSFVTPSWWTCAIRLLVAADIASSGIGFHTPPAIRKGKPTRVQFHFLVNVKKSVEDAKKFEDEFIDRGVATLTTELIDQSIAAVLPKTRTSPLGCTLRSLTHNLALVPPSGVVEARWHVSGTRPYAAAQSNGIDDEVKPLNLLLIPFPYRIKSSSFSVKSGPIGDTGNWGYFQLKQDWLHNNAPGENLPQLIAFVQNLLQRAVDELGEVHGVIFPEYALDADTFLALSEHLRKHSPETGFEFIVAGSSEEPIRGKKMSRKGNYAVFAALKKPDGQRKSGEKSEAADWGVRGCREKHHRWRIDGQQIRRYGLASRLDPGANWWEGIPISRRILDFFEVRAGTSLTVLICEDLARADPCQTVVRAVGPNLVIALLMDGPQLPARWPGHYAGVLADDPGSSVLTLTSLGLIARASVTDPAQSRSIALFRDIRGNQRTLQLPYDCHALAVRLSATKKEEFTLDGRGDGNSAYLWGLDEVVALRADSDSARPWIVGY